MKHYRQLMGIALALVLLPAATLSAEEAGGQYYGVAAGFSTGLGISVRSWQDDLGFQLTGGAEIGRESSSGNLGFTGLLSIAEAPWSRFFSYASVASFVDHYIDVYKASKSVWVADTRAVVGIGVELLAFEHIAIDLMAGYGVQHGFENYLRDQDFGTTFTIETALYYRMP